MDSAVTFWGPVVVIIRRSFCGKQGFCEIR